MKTIRMVDQMESKNEAAQDDEQRGFILALDDGQKFYVVEKAGALEFMTYSGDGKLRRLVITPNSSNSITIGTAIL